MSLSPEDAAALHAVNTQSRREITRFVIVTIFTLGAYGLGYWLMDDWKMWLGVLMCIWAARLEDKAWWK